MRSLYHTRHDIGVKSANEKLELDIDGLTNLKKHPFKPAIGYLNRNS